MIDLHFVCDRCAAFLAQDIETFGPQNAPVERTFALPEGWVQVVAGKRGYVLLCPLCRETYGKTLHHFFSNIAVTGSV